MNRITVITSIFILIALLTLAGFGPVGAIEKVSDATATLVASHQAHPDTRVEHLRAYLISNDSPLAYEASHFVSEADRLGLDWRLLAAIAGVESTFGKQIPTDSYNAWGWGIPTGHEWGVGFRNWKDGISTVSEGLKNDYIDRGAVTINQIGRIYAASPAWSWKVRYFIQKIDDFRPNSPDLLSVTI